MSEKIVPKDMNKSIDDIKFSKKEWCYLEQTVFDDMFPKDKLFYNSKETVSFKQTPIMNAL